MATASTIVDLPEPFSPTRKVTPLSRVSRRGGAARRRGSSSAMVRRQAPLLRARATRTTGGWSKSTRSRYGRRRGYGRFRVASSKSPSVEIEVDNRVVRVSNPDRVYFPGSSGATKLDLVKYYLAVGPGIVNALRERPCMLHRFPKGLAGKKVHQKRLPAGAPDWVETVQLYFPRWGRTADELCVTELGSVIWAVQMSTVEFHPWNSRRADTEKPDEWRIDLDPGDESTTPRCSASPTSSTRSSTSSARPASPRPPAARACTSTCGSTPSTGSRTCAAAPWPSRARSSGVRRRCHHHLVAQGPRPAQALRRLQPERPGPHDRRGVLRARPARCPGVDPDRLGRGRRRGPPRLHHRTVPDRFAERATCTPTSTSSLRHPPLLEWAERDEAEGEETPDEPETTDSGKVDPAQSFLRRVNRLAPRPGS